jgi:hypothetical protein
MSQRIQSARLSLPSVVRIGSPAPPPHPLASVALPPLVQWGKHSLRGEGAGGEPIRTKGQALCWCYYSYSLIPLRVMSSLNNIYGSARK